MEEALYKGLIAAGYRIRTDKGLLVTVRDSDKGEIAPIAAAFAALGCPLYATEGTAAVLREAGLEVKTVKKIHEAKENTMTLLESGTVGCILSTSAKGRIPARDSVKPVSYTHLQRGAGNRFFEDKHAELFERRRRLCSLNGRGDKHDACHGCIRKRCGELRTELIGKRGVDQHQVKRQLKKLSSGFSRARGRHHAGAAAALQK